MGRGLVVIKDYCHVESGALDVINDYCRVGESGAWLRRYKGLLPGR